MMCLEACSGFLLLVNLKLHSPHLKDQEETATEAGSERWSRQSCQGPGKNEMLGEAEALTGGGGGQK